MNSLIINHIKNLLLILFIVSSNTILVGQDIPPAPNPPQPVNDFAGLLSAEEIQQLDYKLRAYFDSTSTQIVIVTLKNIGQYSGSEVALKIMREWGVGEKEKDNGIIILISIEDRKVRIETGYGMEGALPDSRCKRIINEDIVPAFREQRYYDGLNDATSSVIKYASGEYENDRASDNFDAWIPLLIFALIFLFFLYLSYQASKNNKTLVTRRGYRTWGNGGGGWWINTGGGGGWSGGGGSDWGGGGGGGFDFGGGSGGGGGADGSW